VAASSRLAASEKLRSHLMAAVWERRLAPSASGGGNRRCVSAAGDIFGERRLTCVSCKWHRTNEHDIVWRDADAMTPGDAYLTGGDWRRMFADVALAGTCCRWWRVARICWPL